MNERVIRYPLALASRFVGPKWGKAGILREGFLPEVRFNPDKYAPAVFNPATPSLFQLDLRASVFELLLDLRGLVLADIGLHVLRRAFDKILRLFQA